MFCDVCPILVIKGHRGQVDEQKRRATLQLQVLRKQLQQGLKESLAFILTYAGIFLLLILVHFGKQVVNFISDLDVYDQFPKVQNNNDEKDNPIE
ncbi:uncharacterized protein LOC143296054 isoform X2 [Babylonia areolata]|uniref:uncharacterized protein LOC143296054 isoform X2 n=1 Tax=Babylonia areolata TaxID=304850 RepID=UPI003FD4083E